MNRLWQWLRKADLWLTSKRLLPRATINEDWSVLKRFLRGIATLAWIAIPLAIAAYVIFYVFFYFGPKPTLADPRLQLLVPSPISTVVGREIIDLGANRSYDWLGPQEAQALRGQVNVINLALLDGGSAKYARDKSIVFAAKEPWRQVKPFGLQGIGVTGTAIQLNLGGFTYNLNVLQPFVQRFEQNMVYVVDQKGQMWGASLNSVAVVSLSQVTLPLTIAPNKDLNFTY